MSRRAAWTVRARKDLARLDRATRERIIAAAERFARTGYGDVRRLKGANGFALRVGNWRVIFDEPTAEEVRFITVRPRGGAYKK